MKKSENGNKIFFPNLDGLRFIAFFLVYGYHAIAIEKSFLHGTFIESLFKTFFSGNTGVSVFFVLSGFLITYLLVAETELKGKVNLGFFYVRRFLRIWPLYFAVIIFGVVFLNYFRQLIGSEPEAVVRPIYYWTFLSNFNTIYAHNILKVLNPLVRDITWSVSVEEQFYIVWPVLFLIVPKKFFKYIFIAVIILSSVFRYIYQDNHSILYFHSLSVCSDLAVGGLFGYYAYHSDKLKSYLEDLKKSTIIAFYILGCVTVFLANTVLPESYSFFMRILTTTFFAFVILEQNYSAHSFYKFSKFKLLSYWGKYTYGLYLLHPIVLLAFDIILKKTIHITFYDNFLLSLGVFVAGLVLSLAISYVSYNYYEKWFLQLKGAFTLLGKEKRVQPDPVRSSVREKEVEQKVQ